MKKSSLNTWVHESDNFASQCSCVACGGTDEPANAQRRHAVRGLFAALLFSQLPAAHADDDLLDPGKIGAARKSIAAEGLLDPGRISGKVGQSNPSYTVHSSSNRKSTGYGRGMASSVVSSMDYLTQSAVNLAEQVLELDASARILAGKLQNLRDDMAAKLAEYRLGLFCSGCGKTKSEILARGETFPHPGQTIIKPTPEQIATKERSLQAPIDSTDRELRNNRNRYTTAVGERDEAFLQISAGLNLWRTSITFENALLNQDEADSVAAYKAARSKAEDQISKLRKEILLTKDKEIINRLENEIVMWTHTEERLDSQRVDDRYAIQNRVGRANSAAASETNQLNNYLVRGSLRQYVSDTATASFVNRSTGFNELGGLYRMGNHSVDKHDEVLPNVNSFINDFRRSGVFETQSPSSKVRAGSLPPDNAILPQLKSKLRELLQCDPSAGDKCSPAKNAGSGVRG